MGAFERMKEEKYTALVQLIRVANRILAERIEYFLDNPLFGSAVHKNNVDEYASTRNFFSRPALLGLREEDFREAFDNGINALRAGGAHPRKIYFGGINAAFRDEEPREYLTLTLVATGKDFRGDGEEPSDDRDPWNWKSIEDAEDYPDAKLAADGTISADLGKVQIFGYRQATEPQNFLEVEANRLASQYVPRRKSAT